MKRKYTCLKVLLLLAVTINIGMVASKNRSLKETGTRSEEVVAEGVGNSLNSLLNNPKILAAAADNSLKNELEDIINKVSGVRETHEYTRTMLSTQSGILVGYDYNITKYGISEEAASHILEKMIVDEKSKLEEHDWFNNLDEVRQEAVINLAFNLGLPGLLKFKVTLAHLEAGEYEKASKSLLYTSRGTKSLYYRQVKGRAKEISEEIRTGVAKNSLLDSLKRQEGFRTYPYKDSVGIWTVGYGINLQDRGFDEEEALILLAFGSLNNQDILNDYV